jgi:hypothetical protein
VADKDLASVEVDPEDVARYQSIVAPAPAAIEPPQDHPMQTFARQVLAPLNNYPQHGGLAGPSQFQQADPFAQAQIRAQQVGRNLANAPVIGGPLSAASGFVDSILDRGPLGKEPPWKRAAEARARGDFEAESAVYLDTVVGAAGPLNKVGGPLTQRLFARSAEQLAAQGGTKTAAQAAVAEDLATQVAVRSPGFLRSAEDLIRANRIGGTVEAQAARQAAAAQEFALVAGKAEPKLADESLFRQLGVNLDNLGVPPEVKDEIVQNAVKNIDPSTNMAFSGQRRGVQSVDAMLARAQELVPHLDVQKLAATRPGTAFNAEAMRATLDFLEAKATRVAELNEAVKAAGGAANAGTKLNLELLTSSLEMATAQRVFAGARAEAGRSLRILKEVRSNNAANPQALYDRALEAVGGKQNLDDVVGRLNQLWNDPLKSQVQRERDVYQFISGMDNASFGDKAVEYWRNSILSLPITHEINIIGNALLMTTERTLTRTAAATWEVLALRGFRGGRTTSFSEILPGAIGMFYGARRGLQQGLHILATGEGAEAVGKFRETGRIGGEALKGKLGGVVNLPTRALSAEDAVFYQMALTGELASQATRVAQKEGAKGLDLIRRIAELTKAPTDSMMAAASRHAELVTLKSAPDKLTAGVMNLRRNAGPAGTFIMPFIQTPANLLKLGASYSPIGFLRAAKATGEERALMAGRAAVGSAIMGYFGTKLIAGEVTAAAPKDAKERQAFYDSGKRPYSVNINGNWVEFRRFEPLATPLVWTAAAFETWRENGETLNPDLAGKMAFAVGRALLDAAYLSSMSQFINALEDPGQAGATFAARVATGAIPFSAFLRGVAQAGDPYLRDPDGLLDQIQASLPGLSQNVRAFQTASGEDVLRPPSRQGVGALVNPLVISPEVNDPIMNELATLSVPGELGPDGRPLPSKPLRLGFPAEEIASMRLTGDEAYRLNQVAGQATTQSLGRLFTTDEYRGSTPQRKRQLAEKAIADARRLARGTVADEIVTEAKGPAQVARGALMRMGTVSALRDRADYVASLQAQGKLSAEVRSALDANRKQPLDGKPEPTVAEYLKFQPLIREYLAAPPYIIGNATEWAQLEAARKAASAFAVRTNKPAGISEAAWYAQVDPAAAGLILKYAPAVMTNPKRASLRKANPGLERFLSDTTYIQLP